MLIALGVMVIIMVIIPLFVKFIIDKFVLPKFGITPSVFWQFVAVARKSGRSVTFFKQREKPTDD